MRNRGVSQTMPFLVIPRSLLRGGFIFGGKILFFTKSIGWEKASFVVQAFEKQGKIEKVEEYKSLLVYSKKTGSEIKVPDFSVS